MPQLLAHFCFKVFLFEIFCILFASKYSKRLIACVPFYVYSRSKKRLARGTKRRKKNDTSLSFNVSIDVMHAFVFLFCACPYKTACTDIKHCFFFLQHCCDRPIKIYRQNKICVLFVSLCFCYKVHLRNFILFFIFHFFLRNDVCHDTMVPKKVAF